MEEIWKDIEGYEGLYQVSNLGNVRSLDNIVNCNGGKRLRKGGLLKPIIDYDGYNRVTLYGNRKKKNYFVHRLVAQAFIPNPDNLPCINHKDEVKTNNHYFNLEWCTVQYNNEYSSTIEKARKVAIEKQTWKIAVGTCYKPVIQLTKDGQFVAEYPSIIEAHIQTGINKSNISLVCSGKRKSTGGYVWRYKEKNGTEN